MTDEAKAILLQAAGWIESTANEHNKTNGAHLTFKLRLLAGDVGKQEYVTKLQHGFSPVVRRD